MLRPCEAYAALLTMTVPVTVLQCYKAQPTACTAIVTDLLKSSEQQKRASSALLQDGISMHTYEDTSPFFNLLTSSKKSLSLLLERLERLEKQSLAVKTHSSGIAPFHLL